MRRSQSVAVDLVPVMGLASLLIPLLLLGQSAGLARVVEVETPRCCAMGHDNGEPPVVPVIEIGAKDVRVVVGTTEQGRFHSTAEPEFTRLLGHIATTTVTNGTIIVAPDSAVPYQQMLTVMDAARPHYPRVTIAGGPS